MSFFNGLHNYEIALMIMGGLLFLVALGKLIFSKPTAVLGVYFVISISMVAYPSVQSIQYKDGVITIEKKTRMLQDNPNDQGLRASLQQDVAKIQNRPSKEPETTLTIAQANFALGDEDAAKTKLASVLQANVALPAAKELNQKILLSERLKVLNSRVETAPDDTTAKLQLNQAVTDLSQFRIANPEMLKNAQRAQQTLRANPISTVQPNALPAEIMNHKAQIQKVAPAHPNP